MKYFIFLFLLLFTANCLILPSISSAQTNGNLPTPTYTIKIPNPLRSDIDSIPKLISVVIDDVVIPVGAVIAVLMIMYAGFLFVTAQGDKTKITKAKDTLLYATIGAAILLGAKLLASAIYGTIEQLK